MRKGTMIEKPVCVMNATSTDTGHIPARIFGSQKLLLSKDGVRANLDTLLITTSPSITHTTKYRRTILATYITEIVQETSKASSAIPVPSQIFLEFGKFGYIRGETNLTLKDYDAKTENTREDVDMCNNLQ